MGANETISLPVFMAVSCFTLLILMLVAGRRSRIDLRLDAVSGKGGVTLDPDNVTQFARSALPALGAPLVPEDKEERTRFAAKECLSCPSACAKIKFPLR